jgi:hypothetical protein
MTPGETPLAGFWDRPQGELLEALGATAQTLVVFVIRTAGSPLKSRPCRSLLIGVLAVVAIAAVLPYTALGTLCGSFRCPSRCWPRSRVSR